MCEAPGSVVTLLCSGIQLYSAERRIADCIQMCIRDRVPIISYNYGARKPERVKKTIRLAVFYAECIMLVGFCIFQFLPDKLLGLFAASDAMLAIGIPALRIICPHFLLAGAGIVLSSRCV